MLKSVLIAVVGAQAFLSGAPFSSGASAISLQIYAEGSSIKGTILNASNVPVSDAHIFIIRGEEEAISDSKGAFAFSSWQKFPVTVNVDHPDYKGVKLKIEKADAILVRLEKK